MRFRRVLFFLLFLTVCWFAGQAVHELGHVFAAWSSGATVERVIMFPISQTVTSNVEYPLFVYGAGAVFGAIFPVLLWLIAYWLRLKCAYLLRSFAAICLMGNGVYIGFDFSTTGPLDAGLLIEHGASRLCLVLFGIVCISGGLFMWNGQSKHFFDGKG